VVSRVSRPCAHQGWAVAGEGADAVDASGFEGFGERPRRQDGGKPMGQHHLLRAGSAQHQKVMVRMPVSPSASRLRPQMMAAKTAHLAVVTLRQPICYASHMGWDSGQTEGSGLGSHLSSERVLRCLDTACPEGLVPLGKGEGFRMRVTIMHIWNTTAYSAKRVAGTPGGAPLPEGRVEQVRS
jgi:hypothetical protein